MTERAWRCGRDCRRRHGRPSVSGDCRGARVAAPRSPDARVSFAGTARGLEARVVPREGFELDLIRSAGLKGKSLARAAARRRARAAQPRRRVAHPLAPPAGRRDWRRRLQLGAGRADARRCAASPTMVLEQNAVPGLTNRLLARVGARGGGDLRGRRCRSFAGGGLSQEIRSARSSSRRCDAARRAATERRAGADPWRLPGRARDQRGHGGGGAGAGAAAARPRNRPSDRASATWPPSATATQRAGVAARAESFLDPVAGEMTAADLVDLPRRRDDAGRAGGGRDGRRCSCRFRRRPTTTSARTREVLVDGGRGGDGRRARADGRRARRRRSARCSATRPRLARDERGDAHVRAAGRGRADRRSRAGARRA